LWAEESVVVPKRHRRELASSLRPHDLWLDGRCSKFQDCLPERFALEVIENYLLNVEGTVR
jgi:hypothetical protein